MTPDIFTRADMLVAQSHGNLTRSEALTELGRRGRAKHGVTCVREADRQAFANVESPQRVYWWSDKD